MNELSTEKRTQIVAALVEGNSIRPTCRSTGVSKDTLTKLLVDLGTVCAYQEAVLRDLPCRRIEADEIWAFCYAKRKNVPDTTRSRLGYGDGFAQLQKVYGADPGPQKRNSPAKWNGIKKAAVVGNPYYDLVSTSDVSSEQI